MEILIITINYRRINASIFIAVMTAECEHKEGKRINQSNWAGHESRLQMNLIKLVNQWDACSIKINIMRCNKNFICTQKMRNFHLQLLYACPLGWNCSYCLVRRNLIPEIFFLIFFDFQTQRYFEIFIKILVRLYEKSFRVSKNSNKLTTRVF